jgi:hypothetical protein
MRDATYRYEANTNYMNPQTNVIQLGKAWLEGYEQGLIQEDEMDRLIEVRQIGQHWVEV